MLPKVILVKRTLHTNCILSYENKEPKILFQKLCIYFVSQLMIISVNAYCVCFSSKAGVTESASLHWHDNIIFESSIKEK